jgi:hypothetical protein
MATMCVSSRWLSVRCAQGALAAWNGNDARGSVFRRVSEKGAGAGRVHQTATADVLSAIEELAAQA